MSEKVKVTIGERTYEIRPDQVLKRKGKLDRVIFKGKKLYRLEDKWVPWKEVKSYKKEQEKKKKKLKLLKKKKSQRIQDVKDKTFVKKIDDELNDPDFDWADYTIKKAAKLQAKIKKRNKLAGTGSTAITAFQLMIDKLKDKNLLRKAGVETTDKLNKESQRKIAKALLERRGLQDFYKNKDISKFGEGIGKEWAGMPSLKEGGRGKSVHKGVGLNPEGELPTKPETVEKLLRRENIPDTYGYEQSEKATATGAKGFFKKYGEDVSDVADRPKFEGELLDMVVKAESGQSDPERQYSKSRYGYVETNRQINYQQLLDLKQKAKEARLDAQINNIILKRGLTN